MNTSLATLAVIVGAYLVGSVSFAVVVSRLFGLPDPHSYGSGNPGATNVLRTGNKLAARLTLAVFLGHIYPVFHHFSGGKGVSTAAGLAFALSWPLGLWLLGVWLAFA